MNKFYSSGKVRQGRVGRGLVGQGKEELHSQKIHAEKQNIADKGETDALVRDSTQSNASRPFSDYCVACKGKHIEPKFIKKKEKKK